MSGQLALVIETEAVVPAAVWELWTSSCAAID